MNSNPQLHGLETLAGFLRRHRARLRPDAGAGSRRRTPGLRREEVAARANVSVVWYTWLEQGRGGPPSSEVLHRLARALELDAAERELLFLLAERAPPPLAPPAQPALPATLQAVLDAMPASPAIVKTPSWDIVAWNAAAVAVLGDYAARPVRERNLLRVLFGDPRKRATLPDWQENAAWAVAVFRMEVARCGPASPAAALAAELEAAHEDFRRIWAASEVRYPGSGRKRLLHPVAGELSLQYTTLVVDGSEGLGLLVFTPSTGEDAQKLAALVGAQDPGGRAAVPPSASGRGLG